jgi:Cof subfamily protein (haloacid dehalogenase superfamily)
MRYELLAVDIDNTLLAGLVGVAAANRAALRQAEAAGCRVCICTGRGRFTTRPVAEELGPLSGPHILFNGGARFPSLDGEPDEVLLLPRLAVEQCIETAMELGLGVSGFDDPRRSDLVYLARPTDGLRRWADFNRGRTAWVEDVAEITSRDLVALVFWGDEEQVERLHECLGCPAGLAPPRTGVSRLLESHLIELSAAGGTKGEALARVAERLGMRRTAVIAVGDSRPDISMIEYAGLGIAVGNASDEVRAAADYIAPPVDEDAVAHVVERFIVAEQGSAT